jgi:hypothetical protein
MRTILGYTSAIALSETSEISVGWSTDFQNLTFQGHSIFVPKFKDFVSKIVADLEHLFYKVLLESIPVDCIQIPDRIADDVDDLTAGYSYLKHPGNSEWTAPFRYRYIFQCLEKNPRLFSFFFHDSNMNSNGRPNLNWSNCIKWLTGLEQVKLLHTHASKITSGGSGRDGEYLTVSTKNTAHKKRNMLFNEEFCYIVPLYNKNTSKTFRNYPIPRVLAPCLARVLILYTLFVAEFEAFLIGEYHHLQEQCALDAEEETPDGNGSDIDELEALDADGEEHEDEGMEDGTADQFDPTFICNGVRGRWGPSRISQHLAAFSLKHLGLAITTRPMRQIMKAFVNQHFKLERTSLDAHNNAFDYTFGHSSETARKHYAVTTHMFQSLTSEMVKSCVDVSIFFDIRRTTLTIINTLTTRYLLKGIVSLDYDRQLQKIPSPQNKGTASGPLIHNVSS